MANYPKDFLDTLESYKRPDGGYDIDVDLAYDAWVKGGLSSKKEEVQKGVLGDIAKYGFITSATLYGYGLGSSLLGGSTAAAAADKGDDVMDLLDPG